MKPILFNTEMVKAILEGRKTVTRRVVKTKHKDAFGFHVVTRKSDGAFMGVYEYDENESTFDNPLDPPYEVNDVLYVRECFSQLASGYVYKADGELIDHLGNYIKWKPSIHMPKEAARLFLRVTGVRVEKLQDMELGDFLEEGVNLMARNYDQKTSFTARDIFAVLWNSTCGRKGTREYYDHNWNANPYVWVIEFEVIDKPIE